MADVTADHGPGLTGGGPSQQAGNLYHHLYAASRILELLEPDALIRAVYLEGAGTDSADEDAVDVAVERSEALELIQVRWSREPSRRVLQPHEFWKAIGKLWAIAGKIELATLPIQLLVETSRAASPMLRRQMNLLAEYSQLDVSEVQSRLTRAKDASRGLEKDVYKYAAQATGSDDIHAVVSVVRSTRLSDGLGPAALDHARQLVRARLRAHALPPDRWADALIQRIADQCAEHPGEPVTAAVARKWLGMQGYGLSHEITVPEAYVPFPGFSELVDKLVRQLGAQGGVVVLTGPPGSGKTVQLAQWARAGRYPFYACRADDRVDDIRQRAAQRQFVSDLQRAVHEHYPDRLAPRAGLGTAAGLPSEDDLRNAWNEILNALGAASSADSPSVIVIDGVDDARRSNESGSFLELIQKPPRHVILVISTQGDQFLPDWLRAEDAKHILRSPMPPLPEGAAASMIRQLLGLEQRSVEEPRRGRTTPVDDSPGNWVEEIVRLSQRNVLVLRTICEQVKHVEPARRLVALRSLGDQPLDGIHDYYSRLLDQPSGAILAWLRPLSLVRDSLTLEQIAEASEEPVNSLAARQGIDFLIERSDGVPVRFRLFHPSLRLFVQERFFDDGTASLHGRLADIAAQLDASDPLNGELPVHLAGAGRLSEVIQLIDHAFFDRQFEAFAPPSRTREHVSILMDAAAKHGSTAEAFRALLISQKMHGRFDHFFPPAQMSYADEHSAFLALLRVLLASGNRIGAIQLLQEVAEPQVKFRIASELANEAFEAGRHGDAQSLFDIARATALFHAPPRDPSAASAQAACRVWRGDTLEEILSDLISARWMRSSDDLEARQPLPETQQVAAKCETLHAVGRTAAQAGRREDLQQAARSLQDVYRLALALGLLDGAQTPNELDVRTAVDLARRGDAWSDEVRRKVAHVAIDECSDLDAAIQIADLTSPLSAAPIALDTRFRDEGVEPLDLLDQVMLRVKVGCPIRFEVAQAEGPSEDMGRAAKMYYRAGLALIAAETDLTSRSELEAASLLRMACKQWARERPYNMGWTPFFEARTALRKLTGRLVELAFSRGANLGREIGDALWKLDGWALGALTYQGKVDLLGALVHTQVAREWVGTRLQEVLQAIRVTERRTGERVSLLLAAADIARELGEVGLAAELATESMRATKGLPPVDEEPRYYAALELGDCLHERGVNALPLLRRIGRLTQMSKGITGREYAGDWLWLIRSMAGADLGAAFDLLIELDRDVGDEGLPYTREALRRLACSASSLSPIDVVALLWIAGADDKEDAKTVTPILHDRLDGAVGRVSREQLVDWAAGALVRDLASADAEEVLNEVRIESAGGSPSHDDERGAVEQVVGSRDLEARAAGGDPAAIAKALAAVEAWVVRARRKDRDLSLTFAVIAFLEGLAPHLSSGELEKVKGLQQRLGSFRTPSRIDLEIAKRMAGVNPAKCRAFLDELLDQAYWDGGGLCAEALAVMAQLGPDEARKELTARIASGKGIFDSYYLVRELSRMSNVLVSESDLIAMFDVLWEDVEDSLRAVPVQPGSRQALEDHRSSAHPTVADLVRDLLHNRDDLIRRRALEAVGILAREDASAVVAALARWDDLDQCAPWERLTAVEGRLAGLWVVAELEPSAVIDVAADLFDRFVVGLPYSGHFLIREYARRVCAKAITANAECVPTYALQTVDALPEPARLRRYRNGFQPGKASVLFLPDRSMEWDVEVLARLFRVPTRQVERMVRWVARRLHELSEEDVARDRWIMEQAYRRRSRALRTVREELYQHAYRIIQRRWFERRLADETAWRHEGRSEFERRKFDPWNPALMIRHLERPGLVDVSGTIGDDEWFEGMPGPLVEHLTDSEWTLVYEFASESRRPRRLTSHVQSCLVELALVDEWLDGQFRPLERDLPLYPFLSEIFGDFRWLWTQWTYGEESAKGQRRLAAYAQANVAIEEPHYARVAVPLKALRGNANLRVLARAGGLDGMLKASDEVVWRTEWYGDDTVKVLARRDWLVDRLRRSGLGLAIDRWERRELTETDEWGGLTFAANGFREVRSRAILRPDGTWEESSPREVFRYGDGD